MLRRRRLVTASGLALLGVLCAAPIADAQSPSSARRTLSQALNAVGGRDAVTALRGFRLQTTGRTFILDEAPQPGDTPTPASTFTQTLFFERGANGTRLRADNVRTSQGTARRITEVISGRLGYLNGVDANGGDPATKAMTSDRWAAIRREQRLLNPQLILRDVARRPSLATSFPTATLRGRPHRVLLVRDSVWIVTPSSFIDTVRGKRSRDAPLPKNRQRE